MTRRLATLVCLALLAPCARAQGPSKEVQKLEKQLYDPDVDVRARAAWELGQVGAAGSVGKLAGALEDRSPAVRANAAASLWRLAPASKTAIPALKKALKDRDGAVVGNAAGALRKLGVPMAELVPAYRRLLDSYDCDSAVIGLTGLADEAPPVELFDVAWECSAERFSGSDAQGEARDALRKLASRRDRVLVPKMLETLEDLGSRDGSDLVNGLAALEPPVKEAVPLFVRLLDSGQGATRRAAARGLGRMGATALPAVPTLAEVLWRDPDQEMRLAAAESLGEIGPKGAKTSAPALAKAAKEDRWPKVRSASLTALGELGPAAKEAVPVLREALKDPDGFISLAARNALFRVEPGKAEEVAAIADAARPVQQGSLFDDLSQLKATLPQRVPEVFELAIYEKFAFATTACGETEGGRCRFKYEGGAVTGPDEGSGDCEKRIQLAKVDFSVVPGLVKQAPGLLGAPGKPVDMVQLGPGVFCKAHGWYVGVKDAGMVQFKLNGKVDKVLKF
jgi:HEAT repeat protein